MYKHKLTISRYSVPAVGFRLKEGLLTESVDESVARTFACVEVIQGTGPLTSDVTIEIFTQDGSATGKLTVLHADHIMCP